jgi:hypothetical protein
VTKKGYVKNIKEESMKQKKGKKLRLAKETIQDLDNVLGWDQQKMVKGGSETDQSRNTQIRVFC